MTSVIQTKPHARVIFSTICIGMVEIRERSTYKRKISTKSFLGQIRLRNMEVDPI